jgi:hypothetical protein
MSDLKLDRIAKAIKNGVGGITTTVSVQPTLDTDAYTANDAIGGMLTFSGAVRGQSTTGVLQTVVIIDDDLQDAETELWLFDQSFTATADDAAFDPTDADLENLIGVVSTADGTYYDGSDNSVCVIRNIGLVLDLKGPSLFGQLVTRGTPTYAAAGLTVKLGILQD